MGSQRPEVLVLAGDDDDFRDHIRELPQGDIDAFWFHLVDAPHEVSQREHWVARVHVTRNAKKHPHYHAILAAFAHLDERKVRMITWKHDVPESLMPEDIEEWLTR